MTAFRAPRKRLSIDREMLGDHADGLRAGDEVVVDLEPHEWEFFADLTRRMKRVTGEEWRTLANEMQVMLAIYWEFPGSRLACAGEEAEVVHLEQTSLLDAARQGMEEGVARVDRAADEVWKAEALEAVRRTCVALHKFISDDVWETGGLASTREDRALGPIFMRAKTLGWCVKTTELRASVRSHLSGKPVWLSLIYGQSEVAHGT